MGDGDTARAVRLGAAEVVRPVRLFEAELEVEGGGAAGKLAQERDAGVGFFAGGHDRQDSEVAKLLCRVALDQVLHADERCGVAVGCQKVGQVPLARMEPPAKRGVGQAEHARTVGIPPGVQRRATWAALRGRAEALRKADPGGGQTIQRGRGDGGLAVAAEMLPQIVAGNEQDVRTGQTDPRLSP